MSLGSKFACHPQHATGYVFGLIAPEGSEVERSLVDKHSDRENRGGTERRSSFGECALDEGVLPTGSGERAGLGGSRISSGVTNDSVIMMALVKLSAGEKIRAHAASRGK